MRAPTRVESTAREVEDVAKSSEIAIDALSSMNGL